MLSRSTVHSSWKNSLEKAINTVDAAYLHALSQDTAWLPGANAIFNAFSLPKDKVRFILFGESPYPRTESANGYAFWDNAVNELWSAKGLSTQVNRATSFRNFIKMLLRADNSLKTEDTSQAAIAALSKNDYVQTANEFFENFHEQGILLLNASLALSMKNKNKEARFWQPFINTLLGELKTEKPTLILLGKIAENILKLPNSANFNIAQFEHPYNLSFIENKNVQQFFRPMALLSNASKKAST